LERFWEATAEHEPRDLKCFDRGAALVELAFVLPLVMMLILGMVSAGIAFNHQLALTHAAREGGRFAATLPVTNFGLDSAAMKDWLDAVALRVLNDSTGSLGPGVPGHFICVAYVHTGIVATDQTANRIDNGVTITYNSADCFPDGLLGSERRVQIAVARDTKFNALVFSSTLTIDSEAVSRFEAAGGF
jgi:Flp pilus assembly protein TadG